MGVIVSAGNSPHNVLSGHAESGDTVVSGGTMFVLSGGTADATTISSGGILVVDKGGLGSGSVLAGGQENVFGAEIGASIESNGFQELFTGKATRTTIKNRGVANR